MWTNAYNLYGNGLQRDMQPSNWLNQNISSGLSNPFAPRFENYQAATTNPFAGQIYGNIQQPYNFGTGFWFINTEDGNFICSNQPTILI